MLGKRLLEGTCLLLHIHATISENIAELVLEDIDHRDALFLLGIAFAEKFSNPEGAEK